MGRGTDKPLSTVQNVNPEANTEPPKVGLHWVLDAQLAPQKSFAPPTPPQKQLSFVKDAPVRVVVALSVLTR